MTFEEFMQQEEEREKQRRIKRLAEQLKPATSSKPKISAEDKKAEQIALRKRIMDDAQRTFIERSKKVYDLPQPPMAPVLWLVFDRATGELLGEATTLRAYQAWSAVSPPQSFNACRCVQREDWDAAEKEFRAKKSNGKTNGVT